MQAEREAAPGWRKFVKNGMWRRTFAGFSVQAVSKVLYNTDRDIRYICLLYETNLVAAGKNLHLPVHKC